MDVETVFLLATSITTVVPFVALVTITFFPEKKRLSISFVEKGVKRPRPISFTNHNCCWMWNARAWGTTVADYTHYTFLTEYDHMKIQWRSLSESVLEKRVEHDIEAYAIRVRLTLSLSLSLSFAWVPRSKINCGCLGLVLALPFSLSLSWRKSIKIQKKKKKKKKGKENST